MPLGCEGSLPFLEEVRFGVVRYVLLLSDNGLVHSNHAIIASYALHFFDTLFSISWHAGSFSARSPPIMEGPLRQKEIFRWLAETEDRHSDTSNAALIHESAAHPDIRSSNVQNADTDNIKLQSHRPLRELAAHYQPEKVSTSRRQIKRRCPSIVSSSLTSTGRRQDYERQLGRKYSPQPASSSPDLSEATVAPADLRTFLQQANGAAEPYRRQRRHKTREDRYELKEHTNRRHERDGKNKTEEKHGTRRKRQNKTKTGTDLLRSFNAANVASERLTVSKR